MTFLTVSLKWEPDDHWVVWCEQVPVHGSGATQQAALADFRQVLTEYLELVSDGAKRGNVHDLAELERLRPYTSTGACYADESAA